MSKYLIENLFGIEGWNIAWYGVIIAVGMVLGVMLAIYRARKQGLKEELIFDYSSCITHCHYLRQRILCHI